jgi:hypothetical protein
MSIDGRTIVVRAIELTLGFSFVIIVAHGSMVRDIAYSPWLWGYAVTVRLFVSLYVSVAGFSCFVAAVNTLSETLAPGTGTISS